MSGTLRWCRYQEPIGRGTHAPHPAGGHSWLAADPAEAASAARRDSWRSIYGVKETPSVNRYALMARRHWQKWLPNRYGQMSDPERQAFFSDLGQQVEQQITQECLAWEERDRAQMSQMDYLQRVGRLAAIRDAVTEKVLTQMVWLTPEPETADPEEAALDEPAHLYWRWMDAQGMPYDRGHRLWVMQDDPEVSKEEFMSELRAFWEQAKQQEEQLGLTPRPGNQA